MSQLKVVRKKRVSSYSQDGQPFCLFSTSNCLDKGHSHEGGQSSLLSLPIQMLMLVSSKNGLKDIYRILVTFLRHNLTHISGVHIFLLTYRLVEWELYFRLWLTNHTFWDQKLATSFHSTKKHKKPCQTMKNITASACVISFNTLFLKTYNTAEFNISKRRVMFHSRGS